MLELLHEKQIETGPSILGFEEYHTFQIFVEEEDSNFAYLQSLDDENIGFFTVYPFALYPEYSVELDDAIITKLEISNEEEVAILCLITLRETLELSTMNLLAPIIINTRTLKASQYVLPPKFEYSARTPLIKAAKAKGGTQDVSVNT